MTKNNFKTTNWRNLLRLPRLDGKFELKLQGDILAVPKQVFQIVAALDGDGSGMYFAPISVLPNSQMRREEIALNTLEADGASTSRSSGCIRAMCKWWISASHSSPFARFDCHSIDQTNGMPESQNAKTPELMFRGYLGHDLGKGQARQTSRLL